MGKLSLKMRVTLITAVTMVIICIILSAAIFYNANTWIIGPGQPIPIDEVTVDIVQTVPGPGESVLGETYYVKQFYQYSLVAVIVVLVLGIGAVYFAVSVSLKPVDRLCSAIARVDGETLRLAPEERSYGKELDTLAEAFNQLLGRIDGVLQREKSFSAGAAHELKTPLAVIKTNLDVLRLSENPTGEEYEETIEAVSKQITRMTRLVDDLFAVCSLNGYEITQKVPLLSLMQEIAREQTSLAAEKSVGITVSGEEEEVMANSVMLRHALSNLVQNAIKYNAPGGHISVQVQNRDALYIVTVSDTGIGISPQAAERIFEPFYREDKSRSRKMGGAGLGLSIARNIIRQHGGWVDYSPNQPKGSVFTVTLPRL